MSSKKGSNNNNNKPVKGSRSGVKTGNSELDEMIAFIESKSDELAPRHIAAAQKEFQNRQLAIQQQTRARYEALKAAQLAQIAAEARKADEEVPLSAEAKVWQPAGDGKWVRFAQFDGSDEQVQFIIALYDKELSEPYSTFTYEFFIFGWKDLCILAFGKESKDKPAETEAGEMIGAVVSRVSRKTFDRPWRGYIAMLAVLPTFRGGKIGSKLVTLSAELMKKKGCEQVSLETPMTNDRALKLYTDLGFAKVKFLPTYYLDGADAVRLKLFLTSPEQVPEPMMVSEQPQQEQPSEGANEPETAAAA